MPVAKVSYEAIHVEVEKLLALAQRFRYCTGRNQKTLQDNSRGLLCNNGNQRFLLLQKSEATQHARPEGERCRPQDVWGNEFDF